LFFIHWLPKIYIICFINQLRLFSLFTLILLVTNSVLSQVNLPKKYQGLLWEISGNDIKKTSYLYGTMHVSDKLVFNLPDSFFIAIKKVDAVALELNMNTWIDDIMLMQEAEAKNNYTPYFNNNTGFYTNAFSLDAPTEKDLKSIIQFRPTISERLMYRNTKKNSDYQEDTYLDAFIFQAGTKLNKIVLGLENFKQTEELSKLATKAEKEFAGDEKTKEEKEQKQLWLNEIKGEKGIYELMDDSYRRGDLDLLDSLNKLINSEDFLRYMLCERNRIMANKMDSIMKKMPLFTGVGASHLPGDSGVINMLRNMGYKVRPIVSNKFDIKSKVLIDETRFPTQMKVQFSPDSVFSVSAPGKLYEIPVFGSYKYYLFNDMGNGSYYCVQRINHYGKLLGKNQDYILKSIDSLIFENIPGKLISKKESRTALGYPKIEIINKTAKGDIQKQQIIITPTEIYCFKMSGNQEYVSKGSETNDFFNSITFYESNKIKATYQSAFGYSVSAPVNNVVSVIPPLSYNRFQHEIINGWSKNNETYSLVISSSLFDVDYLEEDTFELNMLAERFCLQTKSTLTNSSLFYKNGSATLNFTISPKDNNAQKSFVQIIISGANYFLLCTSADSLTSIAFFNSFVLNTKAYKIPFSKIIDKALYFSTSGQTFKNAYSDLIETDNSKQNNYYNAKKDINEKWFLPNKEVKMYVSIDTREKIYVECRKFSMYYHEDNIQEFWKLRNKAFTAEGSLKISRLATTKKGNNLEQSLLLTDTGCSRGILVKAILHCGVLYTLKTVIDTTQEMTAFIKKFYDSFEPNDTCIGIGILSNKLTPYFFNLIYAKDSVESLKAKGAINYVKENMCIENISDLIKTINNEQFNKLSTLNKIALISCFEEIKAKETIPFLVTLYQQYADSVEIELAILTTLAKLQTLEATRAFLKLFSVDVPITTSENGVSNILSGFFDSLEIGAFLFPEIIRYTKYPEYKNFIYNLMAEIKEADIFKPNQYKNSIAEIILDANYELKKYISDSKRDNEPYRYGYGKYENVYYDLNYRQQKIYNYTSLLAPFYRNKDINKFFTKLLKSTTSEVFSAIIYGQLINNGILLSDSIAAKYSASASARISFYKILKKANNLSVFSKKYLNQKDLVISDLYGGKEGFANDTLVLMFVNPVIYKNKIGNLYVFKCKPKDKKIWKLGYSAVQPADIYSVNLNADFSKISFSFDAENQMQKVIANLLKRIRIKDRKRATMNDFEKETDQSYEN
jgi:uncharacterized protein YbaP (TraB family)